MFMKPEGNELASLGERGALRQGPRCGAAVERVAIVAVVLAMLATSLPPAIADSGGPDTYGYRWVDSKFPNPGVAYSWIDGVTGGTDLRLDDDNCTISRVPIQFPFRFYGIIYNDVYVCANGFFAFNSPASFPQETDAYVSALGADLNPAEAGSGHVFLKVDLLSSPRRFIVTWNGVFTCCFISEPQKFQIVLIENTGGGDGRVLFQYASLTNPPGGITGIESLGATSTLYYTSPLENLLAVRFDPPGIAPPGDLLTVRGTNLAPANVEPGRTDVPMLRLNVSTPTNAVNLRRVRVDVTGITAVPGDISAVRLWRDANADGLLNTTSDVLLASGTASTPATVAQWQTDAPMFSATMDADKGAVTITRITLGFVGTNSADVYWAKTFEDTNHDLILQPGTDRFLSKGRFDASGNVSLGVGIRVVAGSPRTVGFALDIAPNAAPRHLVGARLLTASAGQGQGTKDLRHP